jgi:hypothetical protein
VLDALFRGPHEEVRPTRAPRRAAELALDDVCLRRLDKDPARRYPTAAAPADDSDAFLNDRPPRPRSADDASTVRLSPPATAAGADPAAAFRLRVLDEPGRPGRVFPCPGGGP